MKKILFLLLVAILTACGKSDPTIVTDYEQKQIGEYKTTLATVYVGDDAEMVKYPGFPEEKISDTKRHQVYGKPSTEQEATWSAAIFALNKVIGPGNEIILSKSNLLRIIINENECSYTGDLVVKKSDGTFELPFVVVKLKYDEGKQSKPSSWIADVNITE